MLIYKTVMKLVLFILKKIYILHIYIYIYIYIYSKENIYIFKILNICRKLCYTYI